MTFFDDLGLYLTTGFWLVIAIVIAYLILKGLCVFCKANTEEALGWIIVFLVILVLMPFLLIYIIFQCCYGCCKSKRHNKDPDIEACQSDQSHFHSSLTASSSRNNRPVKGVVVSAKYSIVDDHAKYGSYSQTTSGLYSAQPKPPVVHSARPKQPVVHSARPKLPVVHSVHPRLPVVHNAQPKPPVVQSAQPKLPVVHTVFITNRQSPTQTTSDLHSARPKSKTIVSSGRSKSEVDTHRSRSGTKGRYNVNKPRDHSYPAPRSKSYGPQTRHRRLFRGQKKVAEISLDGKTMDLHHLDLQNAMCETEQFINLKEMEYKNGGLKRKDRYFTIITGQGKHSKNGEPVLKPQVETFLNDKGLVNKIPAKNPGKMQVDLWKSQK
ncbi:hypothetical protein RRG08_054494 [Elysia crispata]|uniref:Smr domain-containing protein n=1 Tax=Elysia crispata TaxID=231223 RepID=A0AAE1D4R8_9GAST|nr:hypothetical protein RRG08_054494 [Elysia crispata]